MNVRELDLILKDLKLNDNQLKEYQQEYNQIVYNYNFDYAITPITFEIRNKAVEIGKKVKEYDCSNSQNKSLEKEKLLKALRTIYNKINSLSYPDDEETYNLAQRIINREVANSIKTKQKTAKDIEEQLQRNIRYPKILKNCNLDKLKEIQTELFEIYIEHLKKLILIE